MASVWCIIVKTPGDNSTCRSFSPYNEFKERPLLVARKYVKAVTACNTILYHDLWGNHQTNICVDKTVGSGVYAYADARECFYGEMKLTNSDGAKFVVTNDIIGIIMGYVLKSGTKKGQGRT